MKSKTFFKEGALKIQKEEFKNCKIREEEANNYIKNYNTNQDTLKLELEQSIE